MTTAAYRAIVSRLEKVRKIPAKQGVTIEAVRALCPAHVDRSPSLSVGLMRDGRVLLHCYSGCSFDEVLGAVGIAASDAAAPDDQRREHVRAGCEGPEAWASLSAAADKAGDALIDALVIKSADAMLKALDALEQIKRAARAAMRAQGRATSGCVKGGVV